MEFTQNVFMNIAKKQETHCIYIDFAKAFDRVSHKILATKLCQLAIPIEFLEIIMHFVIDRKYAMKADGTISSNFETALSSVPQGSNIGPLLFLVMVNDIPSCLVGNVRSLQYADDLKLYVAIASTCDERNLQQTIGNLTKWSNENEIGINSAKTHFMKYLPRVNSVSDYFIGVKKIEEVSTIKDLGVYFD